MARTTRASSPPTRRSLRLNNSELNSSNVFIELPLRPARRRKAKQIAAEASTSSLPPDEKPSCSSDALKSRSRRSTRITPAELVRREAALMIRETEYKRRSDELGKKEDEVSASMSQVAVRESQAMLAVLEEHFTCALCYEIMAQPYSLNPGSCGHSFCALCILRHFFSRLHKACGGWHESVDCPMCRALLVITPDRTPRLDITFPFVPNRTAAAVCESLIEKLSCSSVSARPIVKQEESDGNEWKMERGCKKGKSKEEEEMEIEEGTSELMAWREGGNLRTDWLKKDLEGKKEMVYLFNHWTKLTGSDFIHLKQKYGV
ncbi:unnamed protein product [Mycena citricolor]|uniref:RING-type domain-containing protein n=1 Tax=Mycena citricolor TaxID=2018698 RepID=A0AAD2HVU8_9AGAR|nr:unnamed protein product [Mycena citricolor]CAK5283078.1 unnamed protein product [Mycena citricolor]